MTSRDRLLATFASASALILTLVAGPGVAGAAEQRVSEVFQRANAASARGEHEQAIAGYRRLLEAGVDDPDVHYNLATTYARAGAYGRAILHFERTLDRRAGDEGAERGLAAAHDLLDRRRNTQESVTRAGPPFPEVLVRGVSETALAWSLLALDVLFFGLMIGRRFTHRSVTRLALGVAAPVVGLALVAAGLGLTVKTGVLREGAPGIVLDERTALREGPDPRATTRGEAFEGERVRVLERHRGFVYVRLRNEREGWIRARNVEQI
ncbi:MAG: SH3 domain-containing protein [Myxococcota bacterium]